MTQFEDFQVNVESSNLRLTGIREGDTEAILHLWNRYFGRMVFLARKRLTGTNRASRDEEDVALSAFNSFCLGFRDGRFELDSPADNLWPLLVKLTINKATDLARFNQRIKRIPMAANAPISEAARAIREWQELTDQGVGPDIQVALQDSYEQLLQSLRDTGDHELERIVDLSVQGNTTQEIAKTLDCSMRTVQRKLKTIRALWERGNP